MRTLTILGLLLASCGGSTGGGATPPPAPEGPASPTADAPAEAPPSPTTPDAPPSTAAPTTAPPTGLALRGMPGRAHHVAIALENRGPATARIAPGLRVEHLDGEQWTAVEAAGLTLRADCAHEAPACLELAPGGALRPPDYLGTTGDAQCACEECAPLPSGTYRFVASTCEGGHTIEGAPFDVDAP